MVASTWASIAHHLMGLPDLGPILVTVVVVLTLAWPARGEGTSERRAHPSADLGKGLLRALRDDTRR